jgi:hypothetical protein
MNQQYKHVNIEFKNTETNDTVDFNFKPILENKITHRWLELLEMSTQLFEIDKPERFYDFGTHDFEVNKALEKIRNDINTINNHKPIIDRELSSVHDQDTLNYLHNIFETYHGLLDKQATDYWGNAPIEVREALSDLNIDVHRCETVQNSTPRPRFVSTWYGMPKTHHLFDEDYELFTNDYKFGTVYLTYAEIGKTLEHLCKDKELTKHSYATADAFKPYDYFSADLHVRFHNRDSMEVLNENNMLNQCYNESREFFESRGYYKNDPRLNVGALPLANIDTDLSDDVVVSILAEHQYVNKVSITRF